MEDPIAALRHRFPMNPSVLPLSDEQPSAARPFVLRHARQRAGVEGKHRTPKTRVPRPQDTNLDNTVVQDTYYVPDD